MGNDMPCRAVFAATLLELAGRDRDIVAVTTDARGSVMLGEFARSLPEQFVEAGIAEQDAVGIGAGLALCGKKPFVCGPACFLSSRSLEQVKIDVAYTGANVKLIGVSGGVSYGALGSTHHSLQDIAVLRAMPGIRVILPCDIHQTRQLTRVLAESDGPAYVRMGRGAVPEVYDGDDAPFEIGRANILLDGGDLTLIATGRMVRPALDCGRMLRQAGIGARVVDMHTLKPLDTQAVLDAARQTGRIMTVEEHSVNGGLGGAVAQVTAENCPVPVRVVGIPDEPAVAGDEDEILAYYGMTAEALCQKARRFLDSTGKG